MPILPIHILQQRGPKRPLQQKKRCANEPHGRQSERWTDIENANRRNEEEGEEEEEERKQQNRIFAKMEKYLWGIRIENAQDGVNWICTQCPFREYGRQIIRNHLAVVHWRTKIGKVLCTYCKKEEQHMGNLKMHILGYIGKCKQTPLGKTGGEIWEDIIKENKREDEIEP